MPVKGEKKKGPGANAKDALTFISRTNKLTVSNGVSSLLDLYSLEYMDLFHKIQRRRRNCLKEERV